MKALSPLLIGFLALLLFGQGARASDELRWVFPKSATENLNPSLHGEYVLISTTIRDLAKKAGVNAKVSLEHIANPNGLFSFSKTYHIVVTFDKKATYSSPPDYSYSFEKPNGMPTTVRNVFDSGEGSDTFALITNFLTFITGDEEARVYPIESTRGWGFVTYSGIEPQWKVKDSLPTRPPRKCPYWDIKCQDMSL